MAIEVPHGPVVESLMGRGFAVYAINPKQLDRFRDRYSPAGAKDDSLARLRDAVYHWARVAVQLDPVSKAKYAALRGRGHGHARALRSVADRLLAVACAMLRHQTCYQPPRPAEDHAA